MSTTSLPSYFAPSELTVPSYSAEPHEHEQRIALADRSRSRPSGVFVKSSRRGDVSLRLNGQEDNIDLPVYGSQGSVEGRIELSKTEQITSVEVKIEGSLLLNEIAEGGKTSAKLCRETIVLWRRENNHSMCPASLSFAFRLPTIFTCGSMTYPLPPTFNVKLSGLPGFNASAEYSVSAIINKPHYVPLVGSSVLGIPNRPHVVATPFIYYPRSRPGVPIPAPLLPARNGFLVTREWEPYQSQIRARNSATQDIVAILYVPASRIFCMSQPIPFHLTFSSSARSLASFLPFAPVSGSLGGKSATRIQLIRQSTVDVRVRNTVDAGAKTDIWRVDCIGEESFTHAGDGPTWVCYSGEIYVSEAVQVTGFKAAGLSVKDWILLSITPPNSLRSPFTDLRQTVPIRLTTNSWTADGTGIGASRDVSRSLYSTPAPPDEHS